MEGSGFFESEFFVEVDGVFVKAIDGDGHLVDVFIFGFGYHVLDEGGCDALVL